MKALLVILYLYSGDLQTYQYPMKDLTACHEEVKLMKMEIVASTKAGNVVAFCKERK